KEYHILSPSPDTMNGLTRRERRLKQLMFMALDQLHTMKNTAEIRYWYTEWSPGVYQNIQHDTFEIVWNKLYNDVKYSWSVQHENFCKHLIKGQPLFEKMWELEQREKTGSS